MNSWALDSCTHHTGTPPTDDYTSTTQTVNFAAGTVPGGFGSQQCISIPIIDDNLCETTESFSVSATSTNGDAEFPNGNAAVVQIADNDSKSSNDNF